MSLTKYAETSQVLDAWTGSSAAKGPLNRVAHRAVFSYTPRRGYIYVRSRAISSRCNDNYDEFPAEEIKKAYQSFIGKPVFVNHHNSDHRRARGVIIDAALHEDINPDGTPDTWAEVLMEVDAIRFPRLAEEVLKGNIARTSMGTDVAYSECTACGNRAATPVDYCQHIPKMKGMKIQRFTASGTKEEVLIAERCYGLRFFENSLLVEDPADPTAFVLGVEDGSQAIASALATEIEAEATQVVAQAEQIAREAVRQPAPIHRIASKVRVRREDLERCEPNPVDVIRSQRLRQASALDYYDVVVLHPGDEAPMREYGTADLIDAIDHATVIWQAEKPVHCYVFNRGTDTIFWKDGQNTNDGRFASKKTSAIEVPEGYVFLRFDSHRAEDNFKRRAEGADQGIYLASFTKPHLLAVPAEVWTRYAEANRTGNGMKGITVMKRRPNLDDYVRPMFGSLRSTAYGETKAPAQVDTMRAENCPVCGDDEAYNGDKCSVCGFMQPPSQFQDPDLTKARENDLRQDLAEEQGLDALDPEAADDGGDLQCTNCGEVFSAEGEPETGPELDGAEPEEVETQTPDPEHPEDPKDGDSQKADLDDDLSDLADKSDAELGLEDEDDEEEVRPEEEPASPAEGEGRITSEPLAPEEEQPGEAEEEPESDDPVDALKAEPNGPCPVCGEGTLIPVADQPPGDEPKINEVGQSPAEKDNPFTAK